MSGWPDPIDVIRAALGLPERWQMRAPRAWQAVLELVVDQSHQIAATDAEAARMARLMLASPSWRA